MARTNNYFSTLFAMGFIICLPLGFILAVVGYLFNGFLGKAILSWVGFAVYILIFLGGIFFILHFIFKIIEKERMVDTGDDILDDEWIR